MTILLESPWPILLMGIACEAVLAIVLLRTGRGRLLWAMLAVGALMAAGLVVERLVVTEREAVEQTLDTAVAAVQANDLNRLLSCISPSAEKTRSAARWVFDRAEFTSARINGLEITINRLTSPHTAKAKFRAIGKAKDRKGEVPYETFVETLTVDLRLENGRWLVGEYRDEEMRLP